VSGNFHIRRLALIGTGLIGGSLSLALKRAGRVDEVIGAGRNRKTLKRAYELGIVDRFETDLAQAVVGADVVFVAVPVAAMESVFATIAGHLAPEALLTDGGSVKRAVIDAAYRALGKSIERFVPGHPIAGTEKSGPDAAFADLYANHRVLLTPLPENPPALVEKAARLWQAVGARVEYMEAAHHDHVLAATSHLPHVIAYALVNSLGRLAERKEIFRYAAGGFRDISRIASSDAVMWRDICLSNREELLAMIDLFREGLDEIETALRDKDGEQLQAHFANAKAIRDGLYREANNN